MDLHEQLEKEIRVFKSFDDDDKLYGFYWETIDPQHVYLYDYLDKRWLPYMCQADNFLKQMEEEKQADDNEKEWYETNLLEMLVVTGWTPMTVFKSILDQSDGGWEALERNLHLAKNIDDPKTALDGLPHICDDVDAAMKLAKGYIKRRAEAQENAKGVQK